MKLITVIEAPSNLGLKPSAAGKVPGVYRFPQAIRATDLYSHLAIDEIKRVDAPDYSPMSIQQRASATRRLSGVMQLTYHIPSSKRCVMHVFHWSSVVIAASFRDRLWHCGGWVVMGCCLLMVIRISRHRKLRRQVARRGWIWLW